MKKYLFLLLCSVGFSDEIANIYQEAQNLENQGKYKEAMLLYKKAANLNNKNSSNTSTNMSEALSFSNIKENFYETKIDKVEDEETNKNIKQSITGDFGLYPYKKNYVLPATYDFNKSDDRNQFETVFQISIEKPISYNYFGLNETVGVAYTQKAFWQTAEESLPFRETNYEPEIFVSIPYEKDSILKSYKLGFNHSSNGQGDPTSRSCNRLFLEGTYQLSNLFIVPKVWYRIPENEETDDNPDIYKYYGYGDLSFIYAYNQHQFELILRNNLKFDDENKGSAEFNWTFPLPRLIYSTTTYGMFQAFSGYGNSLIDYNREVNRVGFGITLSR